MVTSKHHNRLLPYFDW